MKKIIASLLILTMLAGCGQPMYANGKEYPTYGFLNESTQKSDQVCYEVSIGNVIWSILGIQNVIMPVYFIGFSIFNPVGFKSKDGKCGINIDNATVTK